MRKVFKNYFVPHETNDYNPHFFRNTSIIFLAIIVLATLSLSLIGSKTLNEKDLLSAIYASVLIDLTNTDRVRQKLSNLSINEKLELAANLKAEDMASKGYFAHTSPEGLSPWYWFGKTGYSFIYAGENLAVNFSESDAVQKAWMASPLHRANILSGNFSEIGIAVKEGTFQGRPTIFVVQMFGKPNFVLSKIEPVKTVESSPVIAIEPSPTVKGDSLEVIKDIKEPDGQSIFISVENVSVSENVTEEEIAPTPVTEINQKYSSFSERFALKYPIAIQTLYVVLGIIVLGALLMLIFIEIKHQRPKSIIVGTAVLFVIGMALYLNHSTELYQIATLF